jgi:hypothetical protein
VNNPETSSTYYFVSRIAGDIGKKSKPYFQVDVVIAGTRHLHCHIKSEIEAAKIADRVVLASGVTNKPLNFKWQPKPTA